MRGPCDDVIDELERVLEENERLKECRASEVKILATAMEENKKLWEHIALKDEVLDRCNRAVQKCIGCGAFTPALNRLENLIHLAMCWWHPARQAGHE